MIMKNAEDIISLMKQYRERLFQAFDRLRRGEITIKEADEINKAMGKKIKEAEKALKAIKEQR